MPTLVLDRPADPCNTPAPPDRTRDDPDAREILSQWIVQIPRRLILLHNSDLGAVIVWAASTAWRDRAVPQRPAGGWARLAGTTTRNFQRWRESAIALGLIETRGSRIVPVAQLEPGEQFARVPIALLFDRKLSRTAKRVYCALSLFRSGLGYSRASVRTLARASGLDQRNARKGLRSLEARFHITARGATGRGVQRYFLGGQTTPAAPNSGTESYAPNPQNGQKRPPYQGSEADKNAPPKRSKADKNAPPKRTKTPPLLQEIKNLSLQKRRAPMASDGPTPRGGQQTKNQARAVLGRFAMKAPGSDFGKQASGLHGKAKPVVEPPTEPHWRPLRDGEIFEKNWEAETLRLGSAGLFRPATNAAVPQLPRRKKVAK